jgi:hypothetical protein
VPDLLALVNTVSSKTPRTKKKAPEKITVFEEEKQEPQMLTEAEILGMMSGKR